MTPTYQQSVVTLFSGLASAANAPVPNTPIPSQAVTGACVPGSTYWDLGVRGDTGPGQHALGITLQPQYSLLTNASENGPATTNLTATNPASISQYCNGSRQPPEYGASGWAVPPGISDATVPNPAFNLTPVATVDEGNNWINLRWGPLTLSNPSATGGAYGNYGGGAALGNYSLAAGSPAIDFISVTSVGGQVAPGADFFGNVRPDPGGSKIDIGAVEFQGVVPTPTLASISPSSGERGFAVPVTLTGTNLSGTTAVSVSGTGVTVSAVTVVNPTTVTATFTISAAAATGSRNVTVTTPGGTTAPVPFAVSGPALTSINPASGLRGTIVPVTLTGTDLTNTTGVTVSGGGGANAITVNSIVVASDTTVTANLVIPSGAPATARNVAVITSDGTTGTVAFSVTAPAPAALASMTPNNGARGSSVPMTLTGSGFTAATGLTLGGGGGGGAITVTNFTVVSDSTITVTLVIPANAALGAGHTVRVNSPNGNSGTLPFTVTGATLTGINPAAGVHGTSVSVTLTGANLMGASAINAGNGITVTQMIVVNPTTITATFGIATGALPGNRNVLVATPIGNTNPIAFTVK